MEEEQVLEAIQVLYGQKTSPEQRNEANQLLIRFSQSERVWEGCFRLLRAQALEPHTYDVLANLLYTKIRADWPQVAQQRQGEICQQLTALIKTHALALPMRVKAVKRLSWTLAAACLNSSGGVGVYLHESFHNIGQNNFVLLAHLLQAIAEQSELFNGSFQQRDAILQEFQSATRVVLDFLQNQLSKEVNANGQDTLFLKCLLSWIKPAQISIAFLHSNYGQLLQSLLLLLKEYHAESIVISSQILCDAISVKNCIGDEAIRVVVEGIINSEPVYMLAKQKNDDDVCHGLTILLSLIVDVEIDWVVQENDPLAFKVIEIVMKFMLHPNRQIGSILLDFWLDVQDFPVVSRNSSLKDPAFFELLNIIIQQSMYEHIDELDDRYIQDFRIGVEDVMISVYHLLQSRYLSYVASVLEKYSSSPPVIEACIFAINVVSKQVITWIDTSKNSLDNKTQEEVRVSEDILRKILQQFSANAATLLSNEMIANVVSIFIGKLSLWLPSQSEELINDGFKVLSMLVEKPISLSARTSASVSLRLLCINCGNRIDKISISLFLIDSMEKALFETNLNADDRVTICEGIVRSAISGKETEALPIIEHMLNPIRNRFSQYCMNPAIFQDKLIEYAVSDLMTLSVLMRFTDGENHTFAALIFRSVWDQLKMFIATMPFSQNELVLVNFFELCSWSIKNLKEKMIDELGYFLNLVVGTYENYHLTSALEFTTALVDAMQTSKQPSITDSFREILGCLNRSTFTFCQKNHPSDHPDILESYYDMIYRFCLFRPDSLFVIEEFPLLMNLTWSLLELEHQTRESSRSILNFLVLVLERKNSSYSIYEKYIDGCLMENINSVLHALFVALAYSGPSAVFPLLGDVLFLFCRSYDDMNFLETSIVTILFSSKFELATIFLAEQKKLLVSLLLRLSQAGEKQRFRSLVVDFAKICRKELSCDVLVGYQM